MRCVRELLDVEHGEGGLAMVSPNTALVFGAESGLRLLIGAVRGLTKVHSTPILRMVTR